MTELHTDDHGNYVEQFIGEPPAEGVRFRVLEDEWDLDGDTPVRVIRRFEVVGVDPEPVVPAG